MMREISEIDSELLAEIHGNCFDDGWNAGSFREMLSNDVFFGFAFKHNDLTSGFILCKMVCDEIEIITFCVLPKFRNLGMGKNLIGAVDDFAKAHSATKIFLEVSEDNVIAREIYKNCGYEEISRRAGYYQTKNGPENAVVMQKDMMKKKGP
jgi:ribosomal-protein-alanine N-acetyltransferase